MLMPHWTDGCIGSMEGLYFESSTTTPFHFLIQSELSTAPSRAQRDLPYRSFDIDAGIDHLQQFGVKYYAASSQVATEKAKQHSSLTQIANSGPWTIFKVKNFLEIQLKFLPKRKIASSSLGKFGLAILARNSREISEIVNTIFLTALIQF